MSVTFEAVTCTNSTSWIDATINGNNVNFLIVDGDTIRIIDQRTVATGTDAGYQGEICMDTDYIYVCIADNTWRRIPLQGF